MQVTSRARTSNWAVGEEEKKRRSREKALVGRSAMTASDVLSPSLSDSDHRAELRKAVIASTVGTTIEWYDFQLYSVVTGLVFGKLFFP